MPDKRATVWAQRPPRKRVSVVNDDGTQTTTLEPLKTWLDRVARQRGIFQPFRELVLALAGQLVGEQEHDQIEFLRSVLGFKESHQAIQEVVGTFGGTWT